MKSDAIPDSSPTDAESVVRALASGEVDALVIDGEVFVLHEAQQAAQAKEMLSRLRESDETIRAIQNGEVDALVIGEHVYPLHGAEEPYRLIVEEMREGALTLNDGTILFSNNGLAEMLKLPGDKLVGSSLDHFVAPEDQAEFKRLLERGSGAATRGEVRFVASDSSLLRVHVSVHPLRIDTFTGLCLVVTDVTPHKLLDDLQESAEKLQKANDRISQILTSMMNCYASLDASWRFVAVNADAEEASGKKSSEILGTCIWDLFPTLAGSKFHVTCLRAVRDRKVALLEMKGVTAHPTWREVLICPNDNGIEIYSRDISQRKENEMLSRVETEILEHKVSERTRALAQSIEDYRQEVERRRHAQQETLLAKNLEQKRLGRDLHDGPQQTLTALIYKCRELEMALEKRNCGDVPEMAQLTSLSQHAVRELSAIVRSVYPQTLETSGFLAAISELAENSERIFNVRCKSTVIGNPQVNDLERSLHLYRIVQETIHNAVKHGRATEFEIVVEETDHGVRVKVCDNSPGFVPEPAKSKGMGLRNMLFRVEFIGGTLNFEHQPDGRFAMVCTMPH